MIWASKKSGAATCACCGYKSIGSKGDYEICSICFWEDDIAQEADPWYEGGANTPSLFQAQENFEQLGAMEERFVTNTRKPRSSDERDPAWRRLKEEDKDYSTTPREIEAAREAGEHISYNYWERNP